MDDEDVVLRVDADPDHGAKDPVIGKRLGPHRIDLEARRLGYEARRSLKRRLTGGEGEDG